MDDFRCFLRERTDFRFPPIIKKEPVDDGVVEDDAQAHCGIFYLFIKGKKYMYYTHILFYCTIEIPKLFHIDVS